MKTHLIISSLIAAGFILPASLAQAGELTVKITDIRANKGTLLVSVVATEAGWNNQEKPVAAEKLPATGSAVELKFKLPAGSYAVQVLHDENDNGKMDSNFMGIPIEGYGFSNNPQVMRKAYFSESKFDVSDAPSAITIRLR
jgi:uncharacterized protein (DUF2141 family)